MRFPTLLFDLDGTLIDTNHLILTTFQHVFQEKLGLDVPAPEIYRFFGEPLPKTMARFSPDRAQELTEAYRAYNMANHDLLIREFAGVREVVEGLRAAGTRVGIVTSKRTEAAWRGLRACRLAHCIDTLVGMDETDRHKPDPEPALLALDRLGDRPGSHVLMVGDSRFDILCGRNAGVQTAAVGWTVQGRDELSAVGPDYWIEHPADLRSLVLGV